MMDDTADDDHDDDDDDSRGSRTRETLQQESRVGPAVNSPGPALRYARGGGTVLKQPWP